MNEIQQIVRRAALRLGWDRANRLIARALLVALGAAFLGILCDKLLFLGAPVFYAIGAVAALCAAAVIVLSIRGWPSRVRAAVTLDERLRLGERISSAVAVADDPSPMARAVVADGRAYARSVPVAKTFPLRLHREYWVVFALAFAAVGLLGMMPQYDLLSREAALRKRAEEKMELQREATRMKRELAKIRKKVERIAPERMDRELKEMEKILGQMELGKVSRADALAKLSELGESLKRQYEHMEEEKLNMSPAMQRQSLSLTKDFADALANKDFAKAAEELKALAQKAAEGKLTPQEKEQLNKELQALAKALGGDPEKLPEALQQLANALNEADAAEAMKMMKEALAQAEKDLKEQGRMAAEVEALKEFANCACKACNNLGNRIVIDDMAGIYNAGEGENGGQGPGGRPPGYGGQMSSAPDNVAFNPGKIKGQMQKGRIIGSYFADGKNLKGEARVEFSAEVEAAEAAAAQAVQSEQVPRAYEGYVREYFEGMKNY